MASKADSQLGLTSRRAFLQRVGVAGAALGAGLARPSSAAGLTAHEGQTARGVVFEDISGDGVRKSGSPGIPGILVSNGRDIVRTDHSGRYQIPVDSGQILFVIKPSGWMTPISSLNLPQFYYIHRPTGTPRWRPASIDAKAPDIETFCYPGIEPTGPLPPSIDFALQRREEADSFRVCVFGDTQVGTDEQLDWMFRDTVRGLLNAPGVAFGITLGDICNVGRLEYLDAVNRVQALTSFPWYAVCGNHDQELVVPDDSLATETFRRNYGPSTYAFDYGPWSFLVLDNVYRQPFGGFQEYEDSTGGLRPAANNYTKDLSPDEWTFVENYLAVLPKNRPLAICMHMPLQQPWLGNRFGGARFQFDRRLLQLISGRPHTLSMSGHTHRNAHWFVGREGGFDGPGTHHHFNSVCVRGPGYRGQLDEVAIPHCLSGDGTPNGYSFITFTGTSYRIEYQASRRPPTHQMHVFAPRDVARPDLSSTLIKANVFGGSERSVVQMRVAGGDWYPMRWAPQDDPAMLWVQETQEGENPWLGPKYRISRHVYSHHVWERELPDVPAGHHLLEVRTTDMFGAAHADAIMIRVLS